MKNADYIKYGESYGESFMRYWNFNDLKKNRFYFYRDPKCWLPFYIVTDHTTECTVHAHEFIEIAILSCGTLEHKRFIPGEKIFTEQLTAGDIIAFMPGECHEFSQGKDNCALHNLDFSPELVDAVWSKLLTLPGLNRIIKERKTLHMTAGQQEHISAAILRLQQEFFQQQVGYELLLPGLLCDLLTQIGRIPLQQKQIPRNQHIVAATRYIQCNYRKPMTLDDIAQNAGVGRTYICRLFKEELNTSIWDYVNRTRIEQAKFHIQTAQNITIYEIAGKCGFEDSSYFARIFRKYEGISPREYIRKAAELPHK